MKSPQNFKSPMQRQRFITPIKNVTEKKKKKKNKKLKRLIRFHSDNTINNNDREGKKGKTNPKKSTEQVKT